MGWCLKPSSLNSQFSSSNTHKDMHVLKFGGTSVGTTESLMNVKNIVESIDEPVIVVVSALGGLTDRLISTAGMAAAGETFSSELDGIVQRHHKIINEVISEELRDDIRSKIDDLLEELGRIYLGVSYLRDLPSETLDVIVSFGERMSSIIVAGMIRNARHHNSLEFVKTEKWYGKNIADTTLTADHILKEFGKDNIGIEITGGFISTDRDTGRITNLGRGGSDYTAALIAATLDADVLEIWTDVDGFMTADPRIIPAAHVVPEMSFVESMELCSYGAKVIYPPTIYPVFHKNIPIRILNTFNPTAPGTYISDHVDNSLFPIKGISALHNINILTLHGDMARKAHEVNSRTYSALSRHGISLYQLNHETRPDAFTFALANSDAQKATKILEEEFAPELLNGDLKSIKITEGLSSLAIVGDGIRSYQNLFSDLEKILTESGIRICGASDGLSDSTINFIIPTERVNEALGICHSYIYNDSAIQ